MRCAHRHEHNACGNISFHSCAGSIFIIAWIKKISLQEIQRDLTKLNNEYAH